MMASLVRERDKRFRTTAGLQSIGLGDTPLDIVETLKSAPIFSVLSRRDLKRFAQTARVRTYQPGSAIVKEGARGVACYIISTGKVEVVKGADTAGVAVLATLAPGDLFGEMAVITPHPRNATVRAIEETECVVIRNIDFRAELRVHPEIAVKMLPVLVGRLREAEARPTE